MLKHIMLGGGAAGALTAAYLVGGLTLSGVLAQTTPAPSPATPATAPPAPATSAQPGAPSATEASEPADTANEATESTALASQAKISADEARAAALAKFPGATISKVELDNENSVVAYSVRLTDSSGTRQDVSIDATNGTVLAEQAETPGAPEGPETAD